MHFCFLKTLLFSALVLSSCSSSRQLLKNREAKALASQLNESSVFQEAWTGFTLFDPTSSAFLYTLNSDKAFTPASNTKIFSLYAFLHTLQDSVITLAHQLQNDTLHIWGMGDPGFLHPDFDKNEDIFRVLSDTVYELVLHNSHFNDYRFGSGWAWDDYPYNYQPEKSSFPLYGNKVYLNWEEEKEKVLINPPYFENYIVLSNESTTLIERDEFSNAFTLNPNRLGALKSKDEAFGIPFVNYPYLQAELLSDTLKRDVILSFEENISLPVNYIKGEPASIYLRKMMKDSDNFIAEQLALQASLLKFGYANTQTYLAYAIDSIFNFIPGNIR